MKKASALLAALLALSITACSGTDIPEQKSDSEVTAESSEINSGTSAYDTSEAEVQPVYNYKYEEYANLTPEEIVSRLTLEQKAAQMVQPAVYAVQDWQMKAFDFGSILSKYDSVYYNQWQEIVDGFQRLAIESDSGIPYLYGQDDVHGVNYCLNSVLFPHNIGLGAANDEKLMYQVGLITADEAKLCHMLWNFAPCVAQSVDPRWGRTYESYGADLDMITALSTAYTRGLVDGGVVACAKHFFGDGNVIFGTGEKSDVDRLIDRGDSRLSEDEINELLAVYQAQIDAGVQTIMVSHSSLNGIKMHEYGEYIGRLKNEMGFEGFIVSDWNSVKNTSPSTYRGQVITAVNAGIDMLMEVDTYYDAMNIIIGAVNSGEIAQERVDDAVTRIIRVKKNAGLFDDPMCENLVTNQSVTGSQEYRMIAERLVEKSLVLLKNDNNTLPLKSGTSVYITGPAADNAQAQCGGWTIDWNSSPKKQIQGVTTILGGFVKNAEEYGITVITEKSQAKNADVVLLVVGEQAYAEWNGDTVDLELCGDLGLYGNKEAIEEAYSLGKPVVACIVAGRQVIIDDYYDNWDSVVMFYLPGSEGQGVANVLCGKADFSGKLPSAWYSSTGQIGTDSCWLAQGYGLTY
ncbi:MAG: glycoside hydrolase family 3 protein [Oscillospiraceae bacterium]